VSTEEDRPLRDVRWDLAAAPYLKGYIDALAADLELLDRTSSAVAAVDLDGFNAQIERMTTTLLTMRFALSMRRWLGTKPQFEVPKEE
jgi:hypothetical protein